MSGITFTYQPEQKYGSRVQTTLVGGKPLDRRQQYRTVTNSMLVEGGHNYRALTRGSDRRELEPQYDIIEGALRKRGRIITPERGRIREPRDD